MNYMKVTPREKWINWWGFVGVNSVAGGAHSTHESSRKLNSWKGRVSGAGESGGTSRRRKMAINKKVFPFKHFFFFLFLKNDERSEQKTTKFNCVVKCFHFPGKSRKRVKASPRFCECSVKSISMSVSKPKFLLDWKAVICNKSHSKNWNHFHFKLA